jgi:hypothetical protein
MDNQKLTNSGPKAFDIIPPGNTAATPSSRPVIPDPSPQQPDPMLHPNRPPNDTPAEPSPVAEPDNLSLSELPSTTVAVSGEQALIHQSPTVVNHDFHRPKISRVLLVVIMCVIVIVMTLIGITIYLRIVY